MHHTTSHAILLIAGLTVISACSKSDREQQFTALQQQPIPIATVSQAKIGADEPIRPLTELDPDALQTPVVKLGRSLFHDKRLSGDGTLNCASCHAIDKGGDDGLPTATGIRRQKGPINSPTVLNSGFNFRQFWDGRAPSLDEQARGPVEAGIEMGAKWENVVARLNEDSDLQQQFKNVFGNAEITEDLVVHAIARFEESLVTPAPFDRYLLGDVNAISGEAAQGYQLFKRYGCSSCHQGINVGGNIYQQFGAVQSVDVDDFIQTGGEPEVHDRNMDVDLVKVPTLRNIELTAPYFHGGKINDLLMAVKLMGISQTGVVINDEDIELITAFLKSLTGDWQQHARLIE